MNIKHRLYYILAAVFLVVMGGSTGYYLILGSEPKFLDCVYMTVISLTTVGYEEVVEVTGNMWAQIFTMFLITFGMGIILYGIISRMTHPKLEPKLRKAGADAVVSPNIIGALRIASEMIRPTVVDFWTVCCAAIRGICGSTRSPFQRILRRSEKPSTNAV